MQNSFQLTSNPFSTRFTRPGSMPYLFSQEQDFGAIVETFQAGHHVGQIIGPHGCGKTTMTYALQQRFRDDFPSVRRITIRKTRTVNVIDIVTASASGQLLVIDGIEHISATQRWLLVKTCRRQGKGLLVTTHKRLRHLPVICQLQPRPAVFLRIVEHLAPRLRYGQDVLETTFMQANGNIREALMQLYDRFEADRHRNTNEHDLRGVDPTINR